METSRRDKSAPPPTSVAVRLLFCDFSVLTQDARVSDHIKSTLIDWVALGDGPREESFDEWAHARAQDVLSGHTHPVVPVGVGWDESERIDFEAQRLLEHYEERAARSGTAAKLQLNAGVLREMYELPELVRPRDWAGRRDSVNTDAMESLERWKNGEPREYLDWAWDSLDAHHLSSLETAGERVIRVIAAAATADLPRPGEEKHVAFLHRLRGWMAPHELDAVVQAWFATECDPHDTDPDSFIVLAPTTGLSVAALQDFLWVAADDVKLFNPF